MIAPLLPLYWVRKLALTDGQISLVMTIFSAAMVLGSLAMRRVVARLGRERALAAATLGYALYPFLTSFSPSVWWLVPWAALAGFLNAALTVTLMDNLVSVTPDADRTTHIARVQRGREYRPVCGADHRRPFGGERYADYVGAARGRRCGFGRRGIDGVTSLPFRLAPVMWPDPRSS